jgi:RNA polymerase sigma-70 factor (ECF subfamily)
MNGLPIAAALPVALPADPGDRLAALFDAHHERLYRLARRLAPQADEALDLVQETFLKAARSPGAVPAGATNEEAWLVRVLINIRRDQWRKTLVRKRHDREIRHSSGVDDGQEAALIARATVWRALDILKPRRRAALVMYELEGLPIPAIASLLGIGAVTVRWHLSMGRRDLARVLKSQVGGTDEDR